MVATNVFDSKLDCGEIFRSEPRARLGDGALRQLDESGRRAVKRFRPACDRPRAFALDIRDDPGDCLYDARIRPARRARERGAARRLIKGVPVEPAHRRHIIFSMGRTRMDEAPAAFSFSSVSQKTFS